MSILVTGGAGFIGSHLVHALADRREKVVVLDNLSSGFPEHLPEGTTLVVGDIGDRDLVVRLIAEHAVTAIAHLAASIVVSDSMTDPLGYYLNNTSKSRDLIAAALEGGVKTFLYSSTAAVYGEPDGGPIGEDAPLRPMSPYGGSKLMTEQMLRDVARAHDFRFACLRYFNVAGADPSGRTGQSNPRATHLIKAACQAALGLRPAFELYGDDYDTPDGTCIRDFVHVSDLVEAHVLALRHLASGGASQTFNCGYGRGFSVMDVVNAVKLVSGNDFPVRIVERRPGDPSVIVADPTLIKRELAWQPRHADIEAIIRNSYNWERRMAQSVA